MNTKKSSLLLFAILSALLIAGRVTHAQIEFQNPIELASPNPETDGWFGYVLSRLPMTNEISAGEVGVAGSGSSLGKALIMGGRKGETMPSILANILHKD